jgi:Spy/CpxP family protein refolding chaperone
LGSEDIAIANQTVSQQQVQVILLSSGFVNFCLLETSYIADHSFPRRVSMKSVQRFFSVSAILALSMIPATFAPVAAYRQAGPEGRGSMPRMHRMLGAEAPWISIALKHQSELNLTPDQVATLEKIRTLYRDQTSPIQEQLRAIEGELATSLQETPANLIQAKLKIEQAEKLRSQLRYLRVETLENGRSVLTAQQRDQLKNLASFRRHNSRKSPGQPS